eukprot:3790847-Amphidinium_carterae.1
MGADLALIDQRLIQQQSIIDKLIVSIRTLEKSFGALSEYHNSLAADHTVLISCLEAKATLSRQDLDQGHVSARVRDILQCPGLACSIGQKAGVRAAVALAGVSASHGSFVKQELPLLVSGLPPCIYMCGGMPEGL